MKQFNAIQDLEYLKNINIGYLWLEAPSLIILVGRRRKDIFHKGWLNDWLN